jgi:hypothetical protein
VPALPRTAGGGGGGGHRRERAFSLQRWTADFTESGVRRSNPDLDREWASCVVVPRSGGGGGGEKGAAPPLPAAVGAWDAVADAMSCEERSSGAASRALKRARRALELHRGTPPSPLRSARELQEEVLTLLLTGESMLQAPALVRAALQAGFYPFGVPVKPPLPVHDERASGLLALELGGVQREPPAGGGDGLDHGGRIVLTRLDKLVVGKRCRRTILPSESSSPSPSSASGSNAAASVTRRDRFPYRLTVSDQSRDVRFVWNLLIREHGIDWLGFDAVRHALLESSQVHDGDGPPRKKKQDNSPLWIAICLWDDGSPTPNEDEEEEEEEENPVSVELGYGGATCACRRTPAPGTVRGATRSAPRPRRAGCFCGAASA